MVQEVSKEPVLGLHKIKYLGVEGERGEREGGERGERGGREEVNRKA